MRRRYHYPLKKNQTFTLNITSMTDMFTILLVFLLQNYSTTEVKLEAEKDVRVPSSESTANLVQGVKITLSPSVLKLDDKVVAELKNMDFETSVLEKNDPQFIRPLHQQLEALAELQKDKSFVKEGILLFQADRSVPYSTIRKVMYTSSMAGFPQLKLVTTIGN